MIKAVKINLWGWVIGNRETTYRVCLPHKIIFQNCQHICMVFGKKEKDTAVCQGCGAVLSKSKLKVCKKCGMILCPKCRKHHTCQVIRIDEQTNQTVFMRGEYANPQCIIKISDMRIYEIARDPGLMTAEEKEIINTDFDVRRRYVHYQEIIEEKGY